MTTENHDKVDEELLRKLGLGNPELEGDNWELTPEMTDSQQQPEDFMETLDALELLRDLGKMSPGNNPPKLDPPVEEHARNVGEELLRLLERIDLNEPQHNPESNQVDALEPPDLSAFQ